MTTRPLFFKRLTAPHPAAGAVALGLAGLFAAAIGLLDGAFAPRAWPFLAGLVFGIALQRGELSFVRAWRDLATLDDPRQLQGFVAALAVAAALTLGWLAAAGATAPPPGARISPVGWTLPFGAFSFGFGSVLARGSLMVHLRRLGEGSLVAVPALLATFVGFFTAIVCWPWVYPRLVAGAPAPWLPSALGFWGALALELGALAVAFFVLRRWRTDASPSLGGGASRILVTPWPATAAGVVVGLVAAAAYAMGEPLGLTGEGLAVARQTAVWLNLAPAAMPELDAGVLGVAVRMHWLDFSGHAVIVAGVVTGAFAAALASGRFSIAWMTRREALEMAAGGFLIGFGGMFGFGTMTGAALSGVAVGSLSGWVFLLFASLGIVTGLKLFGDPSAAAR